MLAAERAIAGSGSTAPVLTDPAVPTTRHGTSPAATSASICRRSASTSMRSCASVGIQRIDAGAEAGEVRGLLNPRVRFGRGIDAKLCRRLPPTPCSRTSQPAFAARAARSTTKFAMLPPLTSSPPQSAG